MEAPLDKLFADIGVSPTPDDPPSFDYVGNHPYRTKGQTDRRAALKKLLTRFYVAIKEENWNCVRKLTRKLEFWLRLELDLPRAVRAAMAETFYGLALTPGMGVDAATEFSHVFINLVWGHGNYKSLVPGKDLTLGWRPMLEQLKLVDLDRDGMLMGPSPWDSAHLCYTAREFFEPSDRMKMLCNIVPDFDATHPGMSAGVARLISIILPTNPAPESSPECRPSQLLPTLFCLSARQRRSREATSRFMAILARFAEQHLEDRETFFEAHGIFDESQSCEIFATISRLMGINDNEGGRSFHELDPIEIENRWDEPDKMMALLITPSLSPLALGSESSMLSRLERLVASIAVLYHPGTAKPETDFVSEFLHLLAHSFCKRYHGEQSGRLTTPLERRINDELKSRFVRLLREPILIGCFSLYSDVRNSCQCASRYLALLEPSLIVPGAIQSVYASQDSMIDRDAVYFGLGLLHSLGSIITEEKGLRFYLPALMDFASRSINAINHRLTLAACKFLRTAICSFPWAQVAESGGSESGGPADDADPVAKWVERLQRDSFELGDDFGAELSDEDEARLLRSLSKGHEGLLIGLLARAFDFLATAYDCGINATEMLMQTITGCLRSLTPDMLDKAMREICMLIGSRALPEASHNIARIVDAAVWIDPKRGLGIFVPAPIDRVRSEIGEIDWERPDRHTNLLSDEYSISSYARALDGCLWHCGAEIAPYKDRLLDLTRFVEVKSGGQSYALCGLWLGSLLDGCTRLYPITFVLSGGDDAAKLLSGWGTIATEFKWHVPSPDEVRMACEIFESQMAHLERIVWDVIADYTAKPNVRKDHLRPLPRALEYINNLFRSVGALFDPAHASNGGTSPDGDGPDMRPSAYRLR